MSMERGHTEELGVNRGAEGTSPYPMGTVLEMVGVAFEPVQAQRTPASQIPHTVPTTSGEGMARLQDDQHETYFTDE